MNTSLGLFLSELQDKVTAPERRREDKTWPPDVLVRIITALV